MKPTNPLPVIKLLSDALQSKRLINLR